MKPQDFPLSWPVGRERTPNHLRQEGRFKVDFQAAFDDLVDESEKLHDEENRDVVISTNVPLGSMGLPLVSAVKRTVDPGVAVYLWREGKPYVVACDTYLDVHANMRAISATIAALRTIARHATSALMAQSMIGFSRELDGEVPMKRLNGKVA